MSATLLRKLALGLLFAGLLANVVPVKPVSGNGTLLWAAPPPQVEHVPPPEGKAKNAEEEEHPIYFKIINFLILAGALGYVLRKPMKEFFSQRSQDIVKALEEGRAALKESQAKLAVVEEKLRHLDREIAAFKATSEKEMQQDFQRMREEAAQEAEKILEAARARIDTATRAAQQELRVHTAREALRLAEQMIRERMDEPARQRLVSQFMATLHSGQRPS